MYFTTLGDKFNEQNIITQIMKIDTQRINCRDRIAYTLTPQGSLTNIG